MGRVFNGLVTTLLVPGFQDTQCAFKCFSAAAADRVFAQQTIDGFAFDVEVLFLSQTAGLDIREVPITWYYMEASSVKPVRDTWRMFQEVMKIRGNAARGMYS